MGRRCPGIFMKWDAPLSYPIPAAVPVMHPSRSPSQPSSGYCWPPRPLPSLSPPSPNSLSLFFPLSEGGQSSSGLGGPPATSLAFLSPSLPPLSLPFFPSLSPHPCWCLISHAEIVLVGHRYSLACLEPNGSIRFDEPWSAHYFFINKITINFHALCIFMNDKIESKDRYANIGTQTGCLAAQLGYLGTPPCRSMSGPYQHNGEGGGHEEWERKKEGERKGEGHEGREREGED